MTAEPDPAFVMLHSQQVSVSLGSRTGNGLQTPGIARVLILSTNTNLPMYTTQILMLNNL